MSNFALTPLRDNPANVWYTPPVDVLETENEWLLFADLPGVAAEDLDIEYREGKLFVRGHHANRERREYLVHGYQPGDFYRAFAIGDDIDTETIAAELKNGVLTLRLPKTDSVKPRRIEIKTE